MSVFGSMTTAVAGLAAQAQALGNLSDNIANSQTIGYKRVETSFQELVTQSSAALHSPGGVRARPAYTNTVKGNISQTGNATNMAISGAGFFQVSRGTEATSDVDFQSTPYYTRAGDFSLDRFGYLKNTAGMYLNGWGLDSAGDIEKGTIQPIRIQQLIDSPTATQNINMTASLPLTPKNANLTTQTVTIIDEQGVERKLELNWRQQAPGDWRLSIDAPGSTAAPTSGTLLSSIDDGAGGDIATAIGDPFQALAGVDAVQQSSTITLDPTTVVANATYSVTVNGQTFSYTASATDVAPSTNVAFQLWSQINTAQAAPGGSSFDATTGVITLLGDTDGNDMTFSTNPAATLATNTAPGATLGVREEIYVPVGGPAGNIGDVYTINDGTTSFEYTTTGEEANPAEIAKGIAAKINSDSSAPFTASVAGSGVKLVAKTPSATALTVTTDATPGYMPPHVHLRFSGGYLSSMDTANIGVGTAKVPATQDDGDPAYIEFQVNYGNGPQTIKLNVGAFGQENAGLTEFVGTDLVANPPTQDGYTRGAFQNLEIKESGDVVANYDNGRSRVLARVPVIQVTNPDALQKTNGNAYSMTREAGGARADDAGENGAGGLAVSSVEGSNVDIAQEFTKMIVTQRAYSANTKVVSTSDEMLQETLGMKR